MACLHFSLSLILAPSRLSRPIATCSRCCTGTAIFNRDLTNQVPDMVCGNFILGTDRGPFFRTDLELMFETFYGTKSTDPIPRFDLPLPPRLEPLIKKVRKRVDATIEAVECTGGRFDLVQGLLRPQCVQIVQEYLGVGPPDECWREVLWDVLASLVLRIVLRGSSDPVVAELMWARNTLRLAIKEGIAAATSATQRPRQAPRRR